MLMAVPVLGMAGDVRPRCDAKHIGQFWPDPKNDATALQQSAQNGELQVCTRSADWRYGWERLTITIGQLRPEHKKAAAPASSSANSK
jgi:hypothetical protein